MSEPAGRFLALPLRRLIEMCAAVRCGECCKIFVTQVIE
jgi:hypothetical protein